MSIAAQKKAAGDITGGRLARVCGKRRESKSKRCLRGCTHHAIAGRWRPRRWDLTDDVAQELLMPLVRQAVSACARSRYAERGEEFQMTRFSKTIFTSIAVMAASTVAVADDQVPPQPPPDSDAGTGTPGKVAPPSEPDQPLPPSQSDDDVQPQVASPGAFSGGLVRQAGVGGLVGYGRAGVLELGGSAGFTFASDYRNINISPTIGWFLADNFEISAILSISNIKAGDNSATLWSGLIEPSYHMPFNRSMFAFLGLGAGASHVSGVGTGFALAPRVGGNFMVGRSGVLTPSLSYQYTTISSDMTEGTTTTIVALTSAVQFNLGYTAMW
jgi:hypothetical protein